MRKMTVTVEERARVHAALGDEHRLAIVDALWGSDLTPSELGEVAGLPSNLLAFHLDVLEDAGLVARHRSQGDGRRRYVILRPEPLSWLGIGAPASDEGLVLFVCMHNAARSQLAAALWTARTGRRSLSAGTEPAARVHPRAIEVGRAHGLDLSGATPRSYRDIDETPELVVSVCDRARESDLPFTTPRLHWSVPDPDGHGRAAFDRAFAMIAERVDRLTVPAAA
jgi:protein-tyrosine-phosphatase